MLSSMHGRRLRREPTSRSAGARAGRWTDRLRRAALAGAALLSFALPEVGGAQDPPAGDSLFGFEVRGTVTEPRGAAVRRLPVTLSAVGDSSEVLWRSVAVTDPRGGYRLAYSAAARGRPARFELSTPRHRSEDGEHVYEEVTNQWTAAVAAQLSSVTFDVRLAHSPGSYGFALLLLIPALAGSLIAVLHMWGFGHVKNDHITILYVSSAVLFWAFVNVRLALEFMETGTREIILFDPALTVPVSVPIFAFLGVFVYATYSVLEKDYVFFTSEKPDEAKRKGILLAIGNRLFSAPYLAIIAVLVLFRDGSSLLIPFVAFFTGLWIEIIVGALGEVGARMSPVRAQTTTGSQAPNTPADGRGEANPTIDPAAGSG